MFPLLPCFSSSGFCSFARDRRAAVRQSAPVAPARASSFVTRARKGVRGASRTAWRRATTGSNPISAFGVWRDRSRRAMTRVNRTGETRWHRLRVASAPADRAMMR